MNSSFIAPRSKNIFRTDFKLWFWFFVSLIFIFTLMLVGANFYQKSIDKTSQEFLDKKGLLDAKINLIQENIAFLKSQEALQQDTNNHNKVISKSLEKLFNMTPSSISLNYLLIDKNKIIIKGKTPSKAIYNNYFLSQLKSIYEDVDTSFFPLKNGWFNFSVICSSKESDLYE